MSQDTPDGLVEETRRTIEKSDTKCPKEKFRVVSFTFVGSHEFKGYAHVTLTYIKNDSKGDNKYVCTALMKLKDFISLLEIDIVLPITGNE